MPGLAARPNLRYVVPVLATAGVAASRLLLPPELSNYAPLLWMTPAVIVSAWYGGLAPGLLATALSAMADNLFLRTFLPEIVGGTAGLLGLIVFITVGVLISLLCEALHAARRRAESIAWDAVARQEQLERALSERATTAEALRLSEERRRIVNRATNDAIWDWDLTTNALAWSEGAAGLFGYAGSQIAPTALWWNDRIHADDRTRVVEGRARAVDQGGTAWRDEYRFLRADGTHAYVLDRGQVIRNAAGKAVRMVGVMIDLTERRRSEELIRASADRFRQLADAMPQMVWIALPDGDNVYLNHRWQEYTGLTFEQASGWGWQSAVHTDDFARVEAGWRSALASGEPYEGEYRIRRADGAYRWHLVRAVPARGADGTVAEWFGTSTDIDDRIEAAEQLRRREDQYRTVVRASPLPVLVWDAGFRIVEWNPAAEQLFGWPAAEVIGLPGPPPIVPPEMVPLVRDMIERLATGPDPVFFQGPAMTRDGRTIMCDWHNAAVRDPNGRFRFGIGIAQDVTDRKRAEEQRLKLEAQIQQAQKLESLGVLAGGIAHDFNNLLMGMLGYASLALAELPAESPAADSVRQIETASIRAADLTRQMLAYSGKGRFIVQPLDMNRLVDEMLALLRVTISKKAALSTHFAENLPSVEGDATQIRQVVMNLITNASEALGDKAGTVRVTTGVQEIDANYLADTFLDDRLPEGRYVFLEVTDTGVGMSEETRKRLFDPFFTTKFTGRGLGLAAVLGIVRGHKGAIKVYSEPGKGTSMKVLFPAGRAAPIRDGVPPRVTDDWRGAGTVLVADDEPTVRSLAKRVLTRAGFSVLLAADGREAVEVFRANADAVTAVLLDMTMPQLGGEEVFRELRRQRPDVRVILSSGYNEQDATNHFVGKGLAGFLQKPYRPVDLLDKLREALDSGVSAHG
jgi:PAS domain S-box-containing protein